MKRKAPFGLFMREKDATVKKNAEPQKQQRLSDRRILRDLSSLLSVREEDIPKTLERLKKETEEMKTSVKGQPAL